MAEVERPISPHLQIYRPQISSVLSILHRGTGIVLGIGTLLLAWWLLAAASGPEAFGNAQAFFASWFGRLVLLGFAWSLFYHLANGIRHLAWDAGWGFELPVMHNTGWTVVIASAVLTVLAFVISLVGG